MLGEALSYPRRGDGWLKRIGIGGLLILTSFLIVPGILLQGYSARVLRSAALGEETPPAFGDWGEMLVDGLKLYVISLAYIIIPYAIFLASVFSVGGSDGGSALGSLGMLVGGLGLLVVSYLLPAAMTNFAVNDSLGAAFDFGTVFSAAFTGRYLLAIVLAIVVGGILGAIGGALVILFFLGLFVLFYVQMFVFYLYGTGCGPQLTGESGSAEQSATGAAEY